jgi:4-hydroxybenzoate polyprenyltransferase
MASLSNPGYYTKHDNIGQKIISELIHGGHMPALDTCSITFTTALILGFVPTYDLLIAAYLFTYASYTLNRKREIKQDRLSSPQRTFHIQGRAKYLNWIIIISYFISLSIAINRSMLFFGLLLAPLIFSYLYNIGSKRFVPLIGVSRLKEKFLIKNIFVSAGWGLVAFLTLVYFDGVITSTVFAIYTLIFLRVFINTVFSDIKDIKSDSSEGIITLPILFGSYKTRTFLLILNTISGLFVVFSVSFGILPPMMHFVNLITIYGYYYLLRSYRRNADMNYLSEFVAEGEEIVSVPLAVLGKVVL